MNVVYAVDPGKTVGVAVFKGPLMSYELQFDQFGDWLDAELAGVRLGDAAQIDGGSVRLIVSCERFDISQGTLRAASDAHWAIEAIGVARHYARRYGAEFTLKARAACKAFSPDDMMRAHGWYAPGKGHANDATRVLAITLAEDLKIPPPWTPA